MALVQLQSIREMLVYSLRADLNGHLQERLEILVFENFDVRLTQQQSDVANAGHPEQ